MQDITMYSSASNSLKMLSQWNSISKVGMSCCSLPGLVEGELMIVVFLVSSSVPYYFTVVVLLMKRLPCFFVLIESLCCKIKRLDSSFFSSYSSYISRLFFCSSLSKFSCHSYLRFIIIYSLSSFACSFFHSYYYIYYCHH